MVELCVVVAGDMSSMQSVMSQHLCPSNQSDNIYCNFVLPSLKLKKCTWILFWSKMNEKNETKTVCSNKCLAKSLQFERDCSAFVCCACVCCMSLCHVQHVLWPNMYMVYFANRVCVFLPLRKQTVINNTIVLNRAYVWNVYQLLVEVLVWFDLFKVI